MGRTVTVEDVKRIVEEIRDVRHDDERAHAMEDDLYKAVLCAIATYRTDNTAAQLAAEALKAHDIEFARWCA